MTTFEDSAVYEYCELRFDELHKTDGGYYPSKHDNRVFQQAALEFSMSLERIKQIYSIHSKLVAEIELRKINKLPLKVRQKVIKENTRNIVLNNRNLPFYKTEGSPSEPLPSATTVLATEYKDFLIKMANYGWTIPLTMGFQKFNEIIPFIDNEEKVDTYFLNYYDQKGFQNISKDILKLLNNPAHKQCFDECAKAYNLGMYTICLTSLATILEGVLSLFGDNPKEIRMMRICQYHADESINKNQKIKSLSWLSINEFIRVLFEKNDFDQAEPNKINRHWLVHGRTSKIGQRADCLRLFNTITSFAAIKTFEEKIK